MKRIMLSILVLMGGLMAMGAYQSPVVGAGPSLAAVNTWTANNSYGAATGPYVTTVFYGQDSVNKPALQALYNTSIGLAIYEDKILAQNVDFNLWTQFGNPINLGTSGATTVRVTVNGGLAVGSGAIGTDPGAGNLAVQGVTVGSIATVATATTIAPTSPFVNLTGTTAIATITLPSSLSATIGGCIDFIPASTVATTTAGNIVAIYSLVGGKVYQGCYNGTKWYFIGSGI